MPSHAAALLATKPVMGRVRYGEQLVTLCEPDILEARRAPRQARAEGGVPCVPPPMTVAPPPGLEEFAPSLSAGSSSAAGEPRAAETAKGRDPEVSSDCSTADTAALPGTPGEAQRRPQCSAGSGMVLGSPQCPSVGSTYHHIGLCKPCAHAFKGTGCRNGAQCAFCHLCDAQALKKSERRRQRAQPQGRAAAGPAAAAARAATLWTPFDLVAAC